MVVGFHLVPGTTKASSSKTSSSRRRKSSIVWSVRRRQELMRELAEERREAERVVFDRWYSENKVVDKDSLRLLLDSLGSTAASRDQIVDSILGSWQQGMEELRQLVGKTMQHYKEQHFLDKIFDRYDVDKSGFLEPSEVRHLLQAVAQGDVMHFDETDPAAHEAACTSYKLKCIDELKRKGIINEKVWREKRANVVKRHQSIMSPRVGERTPDDDDLDFVLENCDKNNDQKISRDELLAAIDLWIQVSRDAAARADQQHQHQQKHIFLRSQFCTVM